MSVENGIEETSSIDVTHKIVNPTFNYCNREGWNDGDRLTFVGFESWQEETPAEFYDKVFDLYQSVQNLPAGDYEVTVQAHCNHADKLYFYASSNGDNEREIAVAARDGGLLVDYHSQWLADRTVDRYSLRVTLAKEETLRIGLRCGERGVWAAFDDFRLTYMGADYSFYFNERYNDLIQYEQQLPKAISDVIAENKAVADNGDYVTAYTALFPVLKYVCGNVDLLAEVKDKQDDINTIIRCLKMDADGTALQEALESSNKALVEMSSVAEISAALDAAIRSSFVDGAIDAQKVAENGLTDVVVERYDFNGGNVSGWNGTQPGKQHDIAEFWNTNVDSWRGLTGLPAGWYQVKVNAFCGYSTSSSELMKNKRLKNLFVVFADNASWDDRYSLPIMWKYEQDCSGFGSMADEGKYPKYADKASLVFSKGAYETKVNIYVDEKGVLHYGIAGTNQDGTWVPFDNFTVIYKGTNLSAMWDAMLAEAKAQAGKVSEKYVQAFASMEKPEVVSPDDIRQLNAKTKEIVDVANMLPDMAVSLDNSRKSFEEVLNNSEAPAQNRDALMSAVEEAETVRLNLVAGKEDVDKMLAAVETVRRDYLLAANPLGDYRFDMSFLLTNPSTYAYSVGRVDGWYCDVDCREFKNQKNASCAGDVVKPLVYEFMEAWKPSVITQNEDGNGWLLYQKTGLPAGAYRLKAATFSKDPGNSGTVGAPSANLSVGTDGKAWKKGDAVTTEVLGWTELDFTQPDATTDENPTKLGLFVNEENEASWFGLQYMSLEKVAPADLLLGETAETSPVEEDTYARVTLSRTLSSAKWNTFCVPFDMSVDAFEAVKELDDCTMNEAAGTATLAFRDAKEIKAGRPYIVKVKEDMGELSVGAAAVRAAEPEVVSVNGVSMKGNYTNMTVPQGAYFISNNAFYYAGEKPIALKGFRAYIELEEVPEAANINRLLIDIDGTATAIENVLDEVTVMEAELVDVYTQTGVRVKSAVKRDGALDGLPRGLYIVGGKKMIK